VRGCDRSRVELHVPRWPHFKYLSGKERQSQPGFAQIALSCSTTTTTRRNSPTPRLLYHQSHRVSRPTLRNILQALYPSKHHTPSVPPTHIRQINPVTPSSITTLCALGFAGPRKEAAHRIQSFDSTSAVRAPG
jgi:hypothetical protein